MDKFYVGRLRTAMRKMFKAVSDMPVVPVYLKKYFFLKLFRTVFTKLGQLCRL